MINTGPDKSIKHSDIVRLSDFMIEETGIHLGPDKQALIEGRLHKRMRELALPSFDVYMDYVFSPKGKSNEIIHLIDILTTNKTDFFREPNHFEYLMDSVIPEFKNEGEAGVRRALNVWSAGCSSGEEPYTLSIIFNEFLENNPWFRYQIIATDISTRVLDMAKKGVFEIDKMSDVPLMYKRKYFLKGKGENSNLAKAIPRLKSNILFGRINLMEMPYPLDITFDVIFCRNVIIYFKKPVQEKVVNALSQKLRKGGYLFMGHSETLTGMDIPLERINSTVYRKL